MNTTLVCLSLIAILVLCIVKFLTRNNEVFKNRGVEFEKPKLFFGNMLDVFLGRETEAALIENLYERFSREKLFGVFVLHRPVFVIKDVELVKQISIEKFDCFASYGGCDIEEDFCHKSLANLDGSEWRNARSALNAMFTPTGVSSLHRHFQSCANRSIKTIENFRQCDEGFIVDTATVCGMFVAESITTAVLGREVVDECFEVLKISKRIESDLKNFSASLKMLMTSLFSNRLKFKLFSDDVYNFFKKPPKNFTENGNNNNIKMLSNEDESLMDCDAISDHTFLFFNGSFKASTELLQKCFHELATNQKIQTELIREVDNVSMLIKDKLISHDELTNLKFLEAVINETLRKYPPMPTGTRLCTKDCLISTLDGELFKFRKGDFLHFPIHLIQNDPKYFTNPELFDPSRFDDGNSNFLAFGFGPRNCIAANYVRLQAKLLIFVIISKFSIEVSKTNDDDIIFKPRVNYLQNA